MRISPDIRARMALTILVIVALLAIPATSLAAEPEAISDPPSAFDPGTTPTPTIPLPTDATAGGDEMQDTAGSGVAASAASTANVNGVEAQSTANTAGTFTRSSAVIGSGSLPFTGIDSSRLLILFAAGLASLLLGAVLRRSATLAAARF